jgi:RimJ/RimL family protein N-acetyltransferase
VQAIDNGSDLLAIKRGRILRLVGWTCTIDHPGIAWELLRRTHGPGYATEAARAVVDAAVAMGRRRLWSTVRARNAPILPGLEKIGFRRDPVVTDEQGDLVLPVGDAPECSASTSEIDTEKG